MAKRNPALKRAIHLLLVSILLNVFIISVPAQPAHAATLTVTNTNDSGAGSLRQTVLGASSGDTITFNPSLSGQTISLTSELTLDKDLTIDGSGLSYQVAIIGGGSVRVFYVDSGATVVIDQLYLGNSLATNGGCIYNDGDLTVSNSTFAGSEAPVHGGAIYNSGTLTILNSTFSGNISGSGLGGAIYAGADSASVISNSTFWNNDAEFGGGLFTNSTSLVTVTNSTFSGNTSNFGGSAIHNEGTLDLMNSILADNSGSFSECVNSGGMFSNHNLITDDTCNSYVTPVISAYLNPLADNGGPTKTMSLGSASLARNNGDPAYCENADQRGVNRPAACDIGAYEYSTYLIVDSLDDPGDGICDINNCTLRDAVITMDSAGWIRIGTSLSGGTITLGSEIVLAKDLLLDGSLLSSHIQISGDDSVRVFNINSGVGATLDHLDIIHGGGVFGGGINNDGTLTVSNCNLIGNSVTNVGGGIYNSGILTVTDSTFSNNSAQGPVIGNGAGIYNAFTLTVSGSTFTGNGAYNGGGIYDTGVSTTTISNSTFYDNNATSDNGGGAYFSGTIIVSNSTFSGNSAAGDGGGIYKTSGATLDMMNSILAGSTSGGDCFVSSGGSFATNTNNLIEDGSCSPGISGDPLLGLLADNGGPTQTMALLTDSPAIDAGDNPTCESADQRGWSRQIDGDLDGTPTCDIGAYEATIDLFLPLIMR